MQWTVVKVTGGQAISELMARREAFPASGRYPFLIGDEESAERLKEGLELCETSAEEAVRFSETFRVEKWIRGRQEMAVMDGYAPEDDAGPWPGEISQKMSIITHCDIRTQQPLPEVYLGMAELEQPWHLPAVLHYGSWNDCPEAGVHCALHRHWGQRYGAEIVSASSDVIECIVSNPPRDQDAAMALAWEHYWYCTDIVHQGVETVSNLAATLMNSPNWYFWWD